MLRASGRAPEELAPDRGGPGSVRLVARRAASLVADHHRLLRLIKRQRHESTAALAIRLDLV